METESVKKTILMTFNCLMCKNSGSFNPGQAVCLAAQGCGVHSFIGGSLQSQPDILRQELTIAENLDITTNIAPGYLNPDIIIKTYPGTRRPVREAVRYWD
jgi:hypothetical protein